VNLEVMVAAKTRPNCQTSEPRKTPIANKPIPFVGDIMMKKEQNR
jgi:hypothetical protein